MGLNHVRFDLSEWLIHFFRSIDLRSPNAPHVPENMGFNNIYEDDRISALFMLRCAIRQCRLWATWSLRKGVRTIYGPNPAVCFTEMPIAAFLESGEQRERRGEAMSPYGLVFPKKAMFSLGANPVVYGLDDRAAWLPSGRDGGPRIMPDTLLPMHEQYRYVTFNPSFPTPIDWTHEREWRWPYRGNLIEFEPEGLGVADAFDMPGLDIANANLRGMGVVVKTRKESQLVIYDILSLVDGGVIDRSHYSFVLCAQNFTSIADLRDPHEVTKAIHEEMIDLEPYFCFPKAQLVKLARRFSTIAAEVDRSTPEDDDGELGACWLWLLDNTHQLTRALLAAERVVVSSEGRYLVLLDEFSDGRSLKQREEMTLRLAQHIQAEFGVKCGYYSVSGSDNPDGIPSYTNVLDDDMFYNQA